MTLLSAILAEKFPEETRKVGMILASYGELEYSAGLAIAAALGDEKEAFRKLFQTRTSDRRLRTFNDLIFPAIERHKIRGSYCYVIGAFHACKRIRNRYAHSHWVERDAKLWFFNMEEAVKRQEYPYELPFIAINKELLDEEYRYFGYCSQGLLYLQEEINSKQKSAWPTNQMPPPVMLPPPRTPTYGGPS